jgi:hypothetical protein
MIGMMWFPHGIPFPPPKKTDLHDIDEILVKVVLNTFNQTDFQPDLSNLLQNQYLPKSRY